MKLVMTAEELIAVLKVLDAPDREVDDRIWRWVNEHKLNPAAPGWQYDLLEAPAYTSSIDAAHTLIPLVPNEDQHMDYVLEHTNGGLTIGARVGSSNPEHTTFGHNEAIALSRASLEARLRFNLS